MLKIIILLTALLFCGCTRLAQTSPAANPDSPPSDRVASTASLDNQTIDTERKTIEVCGLDLQEKLLGFQKSEGIDINTYKPEEDPDLDLVKKIKACPCEEMIDALSALRDARRDNLELRAKTTFFLIKLGHNKSENESVLVGIYSERVSVLLDRRKDPDYAKKVQNKMYDLSFNGLDIICLVGDLLRHDDPNRTFLTKAFELVREVDGGAAMELWGVFSLELEENPEQFLRALKPKSKEIKTEVYELMCFSIAKDKLIEHLSAIPQRSDVFPMAREMIKATKENQNCE